jgi:hypothetical protein
MTTQTATGQTRPDAEGTAAELRAAAARLRQATATVPGGTWHLEEDYDAHGNHAVFTDATAGWDALILDARHDYSLPAMGYLTVMQPSVAATLADWLESEANWHEWCPDQAQDPPALAIARAVSRTMPPPAL